MIRAVLLLVCVLVVAGCGQKGPLIAPEPEPVTQPDDADDEDTEDAEARRRRDR